MRVPVSFVDYFSDLFDEVKSVMISRQGSYGPLNVENLGPMGVFSRMSMDKMGRVARSLNGRIVDGQVELEDGWYTTEVHDALVDTMNYAAIMIALGQGKWSPIARGEPHHTSACACGQC